MIIFPFSKVDQLLFFRTRIRVLSDLVTSMADNNVSSQDLNTNTG